MFEAKCQKQSSKNTDSTLFLMTIIDGSSSGSFLNYYTCDYTIFDSPILDRETLCSLTLSPCLVNLTDYLVSCFLNIIILILFFLFK